MPRPNNHLRGVPAPPPSPEPAVTPGWRTYPVDCLAKATVATAIVDVPVSLLAIPPSSGTLPWLGVMAGTVAAV